MAWDHCVAVLLVLATLGLGRPPHPKPSLPGLWHSYDCGVKGMQLLVFPESGQTIRFKVVDEFGNRFEVNNCSICYHWVTAKPQEPAVFSADYKGCHVLEKDGRSHLTMFIEAVLPDGRVDVAQDVTLVCPKPDHTWTLAGHLVPPTTFSLSTPPHRPLHPSPEHSFVHPTPTSPSLGSGPTYPTLARPQWGTLEYWEVDQPVYTGTHLTPEQCQVASGHIPCTVRRSSKEACQQAGCCYDNTREVPCYYGNTATVQCFRNGHFILVVSQETALAHRITLANIHLAYAPTSCSPTQETGSFIVFHFPLTRCGTTAQVVGNQLVYENQLESAIDVRVGPRGSVTRDGTFRTRSQALPRPSSSHQAYFFCSASACSPSGPETCSATCGSGTARRRRSPGHNDTATPQHIVSSPGPVGFEDSHSQEPTMGASGSTRNSNPRPLLWAVLLLLAVALVLGGSVFMGLSQAKAQRLQEGNRV
ncbi:zona pellucida sperm-binding protein 1 [Pteropus vampyrus]|uniref:Zona pellucida sperm-binding protein 1 n=1 Tax=Pteropus vampyrus TaxID=132908 RepID=A0A6P6BU58_PTEVA|nr:zona pellucida sperm-binding protein 1 [Pteropus vampyrus]